MTKLEKEIAQREEQMALDIVIDHQERGEEILSENVLESLHDRREAGIIYSPTRVWNKVVTLAQSRKVPINRGKCR